MKKIDMKPKLGKARYPSTLRRNIYRVVEGGTWRGIGNGEVSAPNAWKRSRVLTQTETERHRRCLPLVAIHLRAASVYISFFTSSFPSSMQLTFQLRVAINWSVALDSQSINPVSWRGE